MRRHFLANLATLALVVLVTAGNAFAQGSIVIVNGNAPGVGFNDPTPAAPIGGNPGLTLGEQRLNVFNHAAAIWTSVLKPKTDIFVQAQFIPLAAGVLGSAGPTSVWSDFPGAEYPGMWYHSALADHLAGEDLDPGFADIVANFSSTFAFYFGFDNNEPAGQIDLLVVALHELGHGLGFSNVTNEVTGAQLVGIPDLYSQYTLDVTTNKIWNQMTDAERAASAINLRKVSWNGINVKKDVPRVLLPGEPFIRANDPASLGVLLVGPAAFGPPFASPGLTGDVVLGDDGVAPGADACTPLVNPVAGQIVLVDRGTCTFTVKVKNAQDAGAIGVIVADNAAGGPPAGLGGADPTITIPSGRVTLADGNNLKANLADGVNVTMGLDLSTLAGTDRVQGKMLLATFDPVLTGSSISHVDGIAFRNQLMEPAINPDLTSSVTPPEDLTTSLFTDIGWFSDGDGVPDGVDQCIQSDSRPSVIIESCDTHVNNSFFADGCSISDELIECAENHQAPGHYLACVTKKAVSWTKQRVIKVRGTVAILRCAAKSLFH